MCNLKTLGFADNQEKLRMGLDTDSLSQPPEGSNLVNTLIKDSGFLNCEIIYFCSFTPPSLW